MAGKDSSEEGGPAMPMTMGEFRKLTADVPDDWPVQYVVRCGDNDFHFYPADAIVDHTSRAVEISDDLTTWMAP
jgi:hypothetical protein